jgi:diketogulonate reductase-like aldo/keto reductase
MSSTAMSSDGRSRRLNDGNWIPMLGFGVWEIKNGRECEDSVRWALEAGYRHIDTAQAYGNEESVGQALRDSGVPRDEVFITTKFLPRKGDPGAALDESLGNLGLDYVDLYLVHWPGGGPTWAWPGMQRTQAAGMAKSVGISNFSVDELHALLVDAEVVPAVNQVQFNPYAHRVKLQSACETAGVVLEAYSPLGHGRHLEAQTINEIAARLGRTPAQVLLRWCIEQDVPVLAKSTHQERIQQNAEIFDFELADQDRELLDALDTTKGTGEGQERKWW